jgi:hypothetical protein
MISENEADLKRKRSRSNRRETTEESHDFENHNAQIDHNRKNESSEEESEEEMSESDDWYEEEKDRRKKHEEDEHSNSDDVMDDLVNAN